MLEDTLADALGGLVTREGYSKVNEPRAGKVAHQSNSFGGWLPIYPPLWVKPHCDVEDGSTRLSRMAE